MAVADEAPPVNADGWLTDKQGRKYVRARGRSGVIIRQGDETIEQAYERDAKGPADVKPRAKPKRVTPPKPTGVDIRKIEHQLAEGLQAPGMVFALYGEEWAADHVTRQGPILARQLVAASEHNPWLRRKLEQAMTGEELAIKMMAMLGVIGASVSYAAPLVIYFANLNVPEATRRMYQIPPRKDKPQNGTANGEHPPAASPETPFAA